MDSWIVGEAPVSGRRYVVHLEYPRFAIEVVELEHEKWNPGALVWIDDPGPADAAGWTRRAGEVYFASLASRARLPDPE